MQYNSEIFLALYAAKPSQMEGQPYAGEGLLSGF